MRNVVWPAKLNPHPNVVTRLGRLVHWLALAAAALGPLGLLTPMLLNEDTRTVVQFAVVLLVGWSLPLSILGRGARYVLSAE